MSSLSAALEGQANGAPIDAYVSELAALTQRGASIPSIRLICQALRVDATITDYASKHRLSPDGAVRSLLQLYVTEAESSNDYRTAELVEALMALGVYEGLTDRHGYQQRQLAVLRLWGIPENQARSVRSARWRKLRERELRGSILRPMVSRMLEIAEEHRQR